MAVVGLRWRLIKAEHRTGHLVGTRRRQLATEKTASATKQGQSRATTAHDSCRGLRVGPPTPAQLRIPRLRVLGGMSGFRVLMASSVARHFYIRNYWTKSNRDPKRRAGREISTHTQQTPQFL